AQNIPVDGKSMQPIGVFGSTGADDMADARNMMMGGMGMGGGMGGMPGHAMMRGAVPLSAMAADAEMAAPAAAPMAAGMGMPGMNFFGAEKASGAQPGGELVTPTVRTNFADTALWVGQLETDQNGLAEISVDMPENLTTWKIRVWGMGHGTQVGSGDAEVITRKDLIVRLQAPRFFIQKDEVVLSANIHNYLAQDKQVTAVLEVDGNLLRSLGETTTQVRVPADGEQRVDWRVAVVGEGQATIRVKALTDEESDAMEMQLPSYVHGILKTESFAGTVRPDQPQASVRIRVPEERRVEQSRLEVRYSPTLAGAMVDALPYLAEYPYGCTEQTLNRFLPTVITQKVLMGMNLDLAAIREKRTNLNAQEIGDDRSRMRQWQRFDRNPVFDQSELGRMVKDGVTALTNMQCQDGGWGWFSGWREHSAPHTTAVVVHGLQIARDNDVAIVPGVIERGLEWLKQYESEQIQMLQNASTQKRPWKNAADNMDAFVHMILSEAGSAHGEMREFLYRDRNGLSAYGKTLLGLALRAAGNDHADELAMVMRNLEQFLVQDEENETAYLRLPENSYWWYWYGSDIEANAWYLKLLSQVDPQGRTAPRLVKYLLNNRKHATYWNSTRDTAYCVEAFATYLRATGETQPNMVVEIWLDGAKRQEVRITPENLFSFDNQFVLAGADVTSGEHVVEIRRRGDGPVYFNAYLTNFTLEDPITKAGLEVKVQRKYYRLVPEDKTATVAGSRGQAIDQRVEKYRREPLENLATVTSGELVEVELEIESKNDYEYVIFEDWKAAGFEAVELQSGYTGNGLGAYTEYRDNRVTFFIRSLARGQHSVSYRLHAEIPGRFAALPAQAAAMYAPELKGNSDEIKLEIVD
ncbi:MAG: alpha-2-macroglobulin family protein, partial [Pirellulaceae bacterium]